MSEILKTRNALIRLFADANLSCQVEYMPRTNKHPAGFLVRTRNGFVIDTLRRGFERAGLPSVCEIYNVFHTEIDLMMVLADTDIAPNTPHALRILHGMNGPMTKDLRLAPAYANVIPAQFHPPKSKNIAPKNDLYYSFSLHNMTAAYVQRRAPYFARGLQSAQKPNIQFP